MVSDPEPRRVEVELTPTGSDPTHPSPRSNRRGEHPPVASVAGVDRGDRDGVVSSSDPGPTPVARQTIVVGAVAAILGLAGGWLLGGAGVTDPQPPDDAQVASATTIADVDSSGPGEPTLEPIDTVARTTTSRPQRTVTTITLPGPQVGPVDLHPVLDGVDIRLVGVTGSNTTAEIDVAAGTMTRRNWGAVDLDPSATLIGDGWVLAPSPTTGSATLVTGDGDRSNPPVGEVWSLLPIDGGERFWRPVDSSFGPVAEFEQVDRSGAPTGPRIDTDGVWPAGVDPAGGILTVVQGSTYSIDPDRTDLIGEGDMVAVTESHAVLRRCDASLACDLVLADRATAAERVIPGGAASTSDVPFGFFPVRSEISPDGSVLALVGWEDRGRPSLSVIDTESGVRRELSERSESGLVWSPDGRFGFFAEGSRLLFYDRSTGEVDVVGDTGIWFSVDVRMPTG